MNKYFSKEKPNNEDAKEFLEEHHYHLVVDVQHNETIVNNIVRAMQEYAQKQSD